MSYVAPPAFTGGTTAAASDVQVLSDDIAYLKGFADAQAGSGVSLLRSSALSVSTASWTDIPWSSAPIDVDGWWASGVNIVVPTGLVPAGYTSIAVELSIGGLFATNGTGTRQVKVLQNGSLVEFARSTTAISGDTTTLPNCVVWANCVDGDVLKVQVYQNSGGSLSLTQANCHVKRVMPIP